MATTGRSISSDLYRFVCRPALPKDPPDVMELTRNIWEGDDYVPHVTDEIGV